MMKAEYHERIERAMWARSQDRRLIARRRWEIRMRASRFRLLAKLAREKQADGEPADWVIDNLTRFWVCSHADVWRILRGGEHLRSR